MSKSYQRALQVPQHEQKVIVRDCIQGEVRSSMETCMLCPAATYSMSPTSVTCDGPCPDNAHCHGGAIVVPEEKFWQFCCQLNLYGRVPQP